MIRAYPHRASVAVGETLPLHVSTDARRFRARFARCGAETEIMPAILGWHQGEYAPAGEAGVPWGWPAYDFSIPEDWRGGAYVALLETDDAQGDLNPDARSARALFAVHQAQPAADLLVVLPLFTYHAYNVAHVDGTLRKDEGACLYSGSPWVTLHRPGGGTGGHPWDEVNADAYDPLTPRQTFAHWDAKALAWLERNGYRYDICTDLELHEGAVDVRRYRAIASFGHHEYWTAQMRSRVEAFVSAGGNVAFFGGNTCWFEAEYDAAARAVRRAGRWNENPEWRFTGVSYACGGGKWIGPRPAAGYTVRNARHWVFDGIDVADGAQFGGEARLLGYECDGAPAGSDLEIAADASIAGWPVSDGSGEISTQARASLGVREARGAIFTASTVDWARVLHSGEPVTGKITHNVLQRFLR